jgi:hypothetical protein
MNENKMEFSVQHGLICVQKLTQHAETKTITGVEKRTSTAYSSLID